MRRTWVQSVSIFAWLGIACFCTGLQGTTLTVALQTQDNGKDADVIKFMDLLKAGRSASRRFNVKEIPRWDAKAISSFISSKGVIVEDVNTKGQKRYSPGGVEHALIDKEGDIFRAFSHMSFLYAKGMKQYSEVRISEKQGCVIATLASWYQMEFVREGEKLKLRRCKYINAEGD